LELSNIIKRKIIIDFTIKVNFSFKNYDIFSLKLYSKYIKIDINDKFDHILDFKNQLYL